MAIAKNHTTESEAITKTTSYLDENFYNATQAIFNLKVD
jgi:hypothetical protein